MAKESKKYKIKPAIKKIANPQLQQRCLSRAKKAGHNTYFSVCSFLLHIFNNLHPHVVNMRENHAKAKNKLTADFDFARLVKSKSRCFWRLWWRRCLRRWRAWDEWL
jgi:hypothetical protein